jgi:hypothetical protein
MTAIVIIVSAVLAIGFERAPIPPVSPISIEQRACFITLVVVLYGFMTGPATC